MTANATQGTLLAPITTEDGVTVGYNTAPAPAVPVKPRRTLFQIGLDAWALFDLLDEIEGDISDPEVESAINAWFEELASNREAKVDGYCAIIREFEAAAEARKAESARLARLAEIDANKAKALKDRLKQFMETTGNTKIDTSRFKVAVQANGGKLPLVLANDLNASELPAQFQRVTIAPDTDMLRRALEAPDALASDLGDDEALLLIEVASRVAAIGARGTHLRIR